MSAEKLTLKRLIQIVIMLVILLTAFFYKTFEYKADNPVQQEEKSAVISGEK